MSALSDTLENTILDAILRNTSYQGPSTVYIGLNTASFTDDGSGGTEISGNGYARQSIAFDAASSGATDNTSTVDFPTATGSWGTISHWGLFTAATSGTLLIHGAFSASKAVASGDILRIAAGELDITAA